MPCDKAALVTRVSGSPTIRMLFILSVFLMLCAVSLRVAGGIVKKPLLVAHGWPPDGL